MELIILCCGWFIYMLAWALIEIEIEGRFGWSETSETWYRFSGVPASIYRLFTGNKPLTGYHAAMNVINITAAFAFMAAYHLWQALQGEAELSARVAISGAAALWILFAVVEDFLWFAFNPEFGVGNFKRRNIWWHSRSYWVLGLFPIDYVAGLGLSVGAAAIGGRAVEHLTLAAYTLVGVGLAVAISPLYRSWRSRMSRRDERGLISFYFPQHRNR